jgi:sugar phosphate isomerase/epimerase
MNPAVWTGLYAELPLHKALEILHGQGWTSFEISTEHLVRIDTQSGADLERVLSVVSEKGIEIPQAHGFLQADVASPDPVKRQNDLDTLERHLQWCAKLGSKVVVMHPGGRTENPTPAKQAEVMDLNVEAFRALGAAAESLGLKIALENLAREGASRPEELIELIDAIGSAAVGVALDTSHANIVGLDIPRAVCDFGDLLIATHISDNDGSGDQHRTPGSGTIDWPPISAALLQIGYEGLYNLEIPGERHRILDLRALKSRHALEVARWLVTL